MRWLLAVSLLLFSAPAFADDANILELKAEIQRLLEAQPVEVIRPVESLPEPNVTPVTVQPPLVIHVWPSGCIHGERAVAAIIPKLKAQHWQEGKHYRIVRSYDGPCPQFSWKGRSFGSGWTGWESFNADLRTAMGQRASAAVGVAPVGVVAVRSAPVRTVATSAGVSRRGQHSHKCSGCGFLWWHNEAEAARNPNSHRCARCGRSQFVIHSWGR